MKEKQSSLIPIGLMLFALFFGAGNLIFPVFMGQNSGVNTVPATIGFLVTGVGIPILAVAAIGYSGVDLQHLAGRAHPGYGIFFTVVLYLSIGPGFAIPRTCTTSFEISIAPFFPADMKSTVLYIFAFLFFAISWWLCVSPGKLVSRIGKVITPALLIFLAVLFVAATLNPIGPWQAASAAYTPFPKALSQGFLDGYATMDALAGFLFANIVIDAVKQYGAKTNSEVMTRTLKSGVVAGICLAVIYIFLCKIGADSVTGIGMKENGADILVAVAMHYFGYYGRLLMGVIVFLACLTTCVGLITGCAEYFNRLIPGLTYKKWVTIFSLVSFGIALFGLSTIIKATIPALMFLYPLTIALIVLTFTDKITGGYHVVYATAIAFTFIPSLYDGLHTAGLNLGALDTIMGSLPFAAHGLAWVSFCVVGMILGWIFGRLSAGRK